MKRLVLYGMKVLYTAVLVNLIVGEKHKIET